MEYCFVAGYADMLAVVGGINFLLEWPISIIIWLSSPYLPASKLGYFGVIGLGLLNCAAIISCLEGLLDFPGIIRCLEVLLDRGCGIGKVSNVSIRLRFRVWGHRRSNKGIAIATTEVQSLWRNGNKVILICTDSISPDFHCSGLAFWQVTSSPEISQVGFNGPSISCIMVRFERISHESSNASRSGTNDLNMVCKL